MIEVVLTNEGYVSLFNLDVDQSYMQNGILVEDDVDREHFITNSIFYKIIDNHLVFDESKKAEADHQFRISTIRMRRQAECFSVIDRSQLWYNTLTNEQKAELQEWYEAWLVAPDTLVIPTKPDWI